MISVPVKTKTSLNRGGRGGNRLPKLSPYTYSHVQPNANTAFLGCTPERLFLSKGSVVVTEALAGTRPRGDSHAEDERLGSELLASEKVGTEPLLR